MVEVGVAGVALGAVGVRVQEPRVGVERPREGPLVVRPGRWLPLRGAIHVHAGVLLFPLGPPVLEPDFNLQMKE